MSLAVADPLPTPASPPSPAPAPRWYHFDGADLAFLILAVVMVQSAARQSMLDDPGLGWHLRNIDAMIAHGGWLTEDPFSQRPDRPWRTNQWLGELPLWLGERWAGLEGIAAVTALALAWTHRCLYRMLRRDGLSWPAAAIWTALAALGTSCSWVARPNTFTLFFVLITARICERFHAGACSRRTTLWLLPLFAVWANVHGGFLAGFSLLGLTLLVECGLAVFARTPEARRAARGRGVHLSLLLAGAFAATLVNPYGWTLYPWIFSLLGDPYYMQLNLEWKPPDLLGPGAFRFELLMVSAPLLLASTRRRPNLVELAFAAFWLFAALRGFRYVALWVLIALPLLARSAAQVPWLQALAPRPEGPRPTPPASAGPPPWLWSAVFAAALVGWARVAEGSFARHDVRYIPSADLDRLVAMHREHPDHGVFHAYDWGGYLTWKGWPGLRTWIDDRNETQGKDHIEEYFAIARADPGWEEKLERDRIGLICLFPDAPLTERLRESSAWRLVHSSPHALIFERKSDH
jgi:hypothetical protein